MLRRALIAFPLLFADTGSALACATAPPQGEEVRIAEEEAAIVWNPATRTEHFIRKAAFHSTTRAFGFLVPTPTKPELSEVTDDVFRELAEGIAPRIDRARGYKISLGSWLVEGCRTLSTGMKKGETALADDPVRVIATGHVAGFDASVLEADDAAALARWLGDHGFAQSPQLTQWLARYVAERWKITAFVVASDEPGTKRFDVETRAIDMTFQTDRPFYPYREPVPARPPDATSRLLRVWMLSDARHAATLGAEPWSARVLYAAPIEAPKHLPGAGLAQLVATVFVDETSPRRGVEEIYFAPSPDRAEIRQPPIAIDDRTRIVIPIEGLIVVVLLGIRAARRRRRALLGRVP